MDKTTEIIVMLKAGAIDEAEAQRLLDEDMAFTDIRQQRREIPVGLMMADGVVVDECRTQSALLTLINDLPPRQAQCIELYYFDGYTQEQIAERLEVSTSSVETHLRRAKDRLSDICVSLSGKCPSHRFMYEQTNGAEHYTALMRDTARKQKRTAVPFFPFELWLRYNAGARWTRYNEYRPIIENRLREYLCDCFEVPPLICASTGWRK